MPNFESFPEEKIEQEVEEREKIELIETSPLEPWDKRDLLLLVLGKKPAAWLFLEQRFYKKEAAEEKPKISERLAKEKEETKEALDKLGLVYGEEAFEEEEAETYNIGYHFSVSKNPEKLSRLIKALKADDDREIGLSLGYPKTVVDAYVEGASLDYEELRKSLPQERLQALQKEGVFKFLDFHPSKDHWREEIEIARKHQALIKEKSPKIYQEIIEKHPDPSVGEE